MWRFCSQSYIKKTDHSSTSATASNRSKQPTAAKMKLVTFVPFVTMAMAQDETQTVTITVSPTDLMSVSLFFGLG